MTTSNLPQSNQFSNTWVRLSDDSFVRVPDGADPDYFRRIQEARLKLAAQPKTTKAKQQRNYQSRSRRHRASAVLACASPFDLGMRAVARRLDELKATEEQVAK